jgi:hypothetical protein
MALATPTASDAIPLPEPGPVVVYAVAAVLGLVVGPILGCAQWAVLRHHVDGARQWLWANAAAWGAGMPVIFLGMDYVPWAGTLPMLTPALYSVCGLAGAVGGVVHGRVIDALTRPVPAADD